MSDRAIPRSFRMMQGFGVNTYSLVNKEGKRHFVKFHFTPELGVHSLVWDEALKICGQDPDFHRKDLMSAIDAGHFPRWKFGMQLIPEEKMGDFEFDPLDATKVWPEELVPIRYIGQMELNRNVDEFFPQTEQVAFCTSHIVPGIDFSDDPLLQGRNFSYFDTQISRLGPNWEELPVNRPVCPYMNLANRDGAMRHRITKGTVNYWPNRFQANPPAQPSHGGFTTFPARQNGIKTRALSDKFKEHYNQAQTFYNSLSKIEKMHLAKAFSFELDHCDDPIVYKRMSERVAAISLELAQTVAKNVGGDNPTKALKENKGQKAKGLSQLEYMPETPTIVTRRIAILIADGFDYSSYTAMKKALEARDAFVFTIGAQRQGVVAETGQKVVPDNFFSGMRSTLFDAVFVPGGKHVKEALSKNGVAKFWITESFAHLKAIAGVNEAVPFIGRQIGLDEVEIAASGTSMTESYGVVTGHGDAATTLKVDNVGPNAKRLAERFIWNISQHRNWQRELDGLSDQVAA